MPKKTKRQKILAEQRRHIPSVQIPGTIAPSPEFHFQESHAPAKSVENTDDREDLTVIQKDLTKTLILAAIAIIIELGVYRMLRGT